MPEKSRSKTLPRFKRGGKGKHWHDPEREKRCTCCDKTKSLSEFYAYPYTTKQGKRSIRYESRCKLCDSEHAKAKRRTAKHLAAVADAKRERMRQRGIADIRDFISYDPQTGTFRWIAVPPGPVGKIRIGEVAGWETPSGYRMVGFLGEKYWAHHLAWFFVHGVWPPEEIDHRNGVDKGDGIANLRLANRPQNAANASLRSDNTSGFKGVTFNKRVQKWVAQIYVSGQGIGLGYFDEPKDAADAYDDAAIYYFGEFAKTNQMLLCQK